MTLRFNEVCIDAADIHALGSWWSTVLGWPSEVTDDGDVMLRPPGGGEPSIPLLSSLPARTLALIPECSRLSPGISTPG